MLGAIHRAVGNTLDRLKVLGEYTDAYLAIVGVPAVLLTLLGIRYPALLPYAVLLTLFAAIFVFLFLAGRLPPQVSLPNSHVTIVSDDIVQRVYRIRRLQQRTLQVKAHRDTDFLWLRAGWTGSGSMTVNPTSPGCRLEGPVTVELSAGGSYFRLWLEPQLRKGEQKTIQLQYELGDAGRTSAPYLAVSYELFRVCQKASLRVVFEEEVPKEIRYNVFSSEIHPLPDETAPLVPDALTREVRQDIPRPHSRKTYQIHW